MAKGWTATLCLLTILAILTSSCQPASARQEKLVIDYVDAEDLGRDTAIVIAYHSTFIDETVHPEREQITPVSDELKQLVVMRSGGMAYRDVPALRIAPFSSVFGAGTVGDETYVIDYDSGAFSMIRGDAKQVTPLGRVRMVYYETRDEILYATDSELAIVSLAQGALRPVPEKDLPTAKRAVKIAWNMAFTQAMCVSGGNAYFAALKRGKETSWTVSVVELVDGNREVAACTLKKKYTNPSIRVVPFGRDRLVLSIAGAVEGGKFGFESFHIKFGPDAGAEVVAPGFDLDL